MTEEIFWKLIDASRAARNPQLSDQAQVLERELACLPPAEIVQFDRMFRELHAKAYTWNLWAAAFIIEGGCSDDGFMDFRSGLIGLGRDAYVDAVRDPATLASQPTRGVDFSQEELAYAAANAYRRLTGSDIPDSGVEQPSEPAGEPWDEDRVAEKYPDLASKFGFA